MWVGVLIVAAFVLIGQVLEFAGWMDGIESWAADKYLQSAPVGESPDRSPVATLVIDPADYEHLFDGHSPLDPEKVTALVARAADVYTPAVIGVDLLTEGQEFAGDSLTKDRAEVPVPLVWVAGALAVTQCRQGFVSWLLGYSEPITILQGSVLGRDLASADPALAQGINWGVPIFPRDDDGVVRRLPRQWREQERIDCKGKPHNNTFARQIVTTYCKTRNCPRLSEAEELFILNHAAAVPEVKARSLFTCKPGTGVERPSQARVPCEWVRTDLQKVPELNGTILLIGGTYPQSGDYHDSLLGGSTPGLMLNAHAVQIELEGAEFSEMFRPLSLFLELSLGTVAMLVAGRPGLLPLPFWLRNWLLRRNKTRRTIGVGLFFVAVSLGLSLLFFKYCGQVWLGWTSALLGGYAWETVADLWREAKPST